MNSMNLHKKISSLLILFVLGFAWSCTSPQNDLPQQHEQIQIEETDGFITAQEAAELAKIFFEKNQGLRSAGDGSNLTLVYQEPAEAIQARSLRAGDSYQNQDKPSYYVFNRGEDKGFVIISANEYTYPVLGYSEEGSFSKDVDTKLWDQEGEKGIPFALKNLLSDYSNEIQYEWANAESNTETRAIIEEARMLSLVEGIKESTGTRAALSVYPLMYDIHWDQSPYYNDLCYDGRVPVGCVATALSQIMRYWEYPDRGEGTHYSTRGDYWTNYDHPLNWDNMPKARLRSPNADVARFCFDVAVGVNMKFGVNGSGTVHNYVPSLLTEHYKYANTVRQVWRDNVGTQAWTNMIKEELTAGRPVQYGGSGSGGGHSFVTDGYDSNNYFHINWGWGGSSDGYFLLHRLNPASLGTGGGTGGGFNYGQDCVVGIQPRGNGGGDPVEPDPVEPDPVEPTPVDYPTSYGKDTYYAYIAGVSFGYEFTDNAYSGSTYGYVNNTSKIIRLGNSYSKYQLKPGFGSQYVYNAYFRVWVDFNNDGKFDDNNELLVSHYGYQLLEGWIYIPYSVTSGDYRMRVSMKLFNYPASNEVFSYGEVKDYTLRVK